MLADTFVKRKTSMVKQKLNALLLFKTDAVATLNQHFHRLHTLEAVICFIQQAQQVSQHVDHHTAVNIVVIIVVIIIIIIIIKRRLLEHIIIININIYHPQHQLRCHQVVIISIGYRQAAASRQINLAARRHFFPHVVFRVEIIIVVSSCVFSVVVIINIIFFIFLS